MLEEIIKSCNYVSENSKYVKINENKLREFAESMEQVKTDHWLSFSPYNLLDLPTETIINFLLVYEAIDFSFWGNPKWEIQTEKGKQDGSIALMYAMLKYIKENKNFDNITKEKFGKYLKGNIEIPLFEERYNILKNINNVVKEKMNGGFYKAIYNLKTDEELFDFIINNFKDFEDIRNYKGKTIYFYKLAQLLTSDILHMREKKENIKVDYSHIVGCSDYKIPQGLRALNLVSYNEELANLVDNKIELKQNSEYAICQRRKLLIRSSPLVRMSNSGSGTFAVSRYCSSSFSPISSA